MHSDARECGRWWGLAEFATGKAVGMEDRVPTGTGHHGLPSASFDLPPFRPGSYSTLKLLRIPGAGVMLRVQTPSMAYLLALELLTKCCEILG